MLPPSTDGLTLSFSVPLCFRLLVRPLFVFLISLHFLQKWTSSPCLLSSSLSFRLVWPFFFNPLFSLISSKTDGFTSSFSIPLSFGLTVALLFSLFHLSCSSRFYPKVMISPAFLLKHVLVPFHNPSFLLRTILLFPDAERLPFFLF